MAAVLACGPGAVLSHISAAALWQLLPQRGFVHVTVPGNGRPRAGIRVHRSITLFPSAVTRRNGIPVTTPSRTLTDLHRLLPQRQFAASFGGRSTSGLPLDERLEPDGTRSELEARFLTLCRRHRLPQPGVNERVATYVVDFLWSEYRLIVELDGYRAHAGRAVFEADRARDVELKALGYDVLRFTWQQVTVRSADVARTVRRLLRARGQ